jgi:N-acetylglutamate synthase-like GNAT family acetyltransferase
VSPAGGVTVRDARPDERATITGRLREWWGTEIMVSRGRSVDAAAIGALIAELDGAFAGLATYELRDGDCELFTLNAAVEGRGAGSALLDAVGERAAASGCGRLWLSTTNDNLRALGFYQRRGLRLVEVYPGAVDAARVAKPSIPAIGLDGIPLHDELVLARSL